MININYFKRHYMELLIFLILFPLLMAGLLTLIQGDFQSSSNNRGCPRWDCLAHCSC